MKAQVFTLDLVIGLAIILAILSAAYYISNIYVSYVSSQNSNVDAVSQISSAISAFADSSSTVSAIDALQVSGKNTGYLTNTLNQEIPYPYELTVLADESYTSVSLPSVILYSYVSPSFGGNSLYSLSKIIVVYNSSSACVDCNASIVARSSFPSENTTISVPKCSIFTPSGVNVLSDGWSVFNNTPSGQCTVTIGPYSSAPPTSYLVKGYSSSGSYLGNSTLHVLSLDLIDVKVSV